MNAPETRTLDQLPKATDAHIEGFCNEALATKMIAMGIRPGMSIRILRTAGRHGRTLYVKVARQQFAIRRTEAACILLK